MPHNRSTALRISVVVPTVGRPELARALNSVTQQTEPASQVIVVDNCRDPATVPEVIHRHCPGAVLTRIQPMAGPSRSRNAGAALSKMEYICFLDDDDAFSPTYLAEVRAQLLEDGHKAVYTTKIYKSDGGDTLRVKTIRDVPEGEWFSHLYQHGNAGVGGTNLVVERALFFELGGFDASLKTAEDREFALRLLTHEDGNRSVGASEAEVLCRSVPGPRAKLHPSRPRALAQITFRYWPYASFRFRVKSVAGTVATYFKYALSSWRR